MKFSFTVEGIAKTAGSKKGFPIKRASGKIGVIITDDTGKAGKDWRKLVQATARQAINALGVTVPMDAPCAIVIAFLIGRPKCHFRANGLRKDNAPGHHTQKPDALKLARAIEDALTGIAYKDDAQIVDETIGKRWSMNGKSETHISIRYYEEGS